jgi:hypothetical protein
MERVDRPQRVQDALEQLLHTGHLPTQVHHQLYQARVLRVSRFSVA